MHEVAWPIVKLGNYVEIKSGKLNSDQAVDGGAYPFFTCARDILRINKWEHDREAVLLGGNNANAVFPVFYYSGKFTARQRVYVIWSLDTDALDNRYLYYLIQTATQQFGQFSLGTTTKFITLGMLTGLDIPLPHIDEQRAIASILGSLDDKIELNRRMNRTLEQMAAAIFKAWFVDFEPVRAKASGATSFPGMPQPVFNALPATFSDSELGPIPQGWEVKRLKDAARLTMGQSPKSEFYNTTGDGLPFHQGVTNYGTRFPIHKTFCTVQDRIAEQGDILFSVRAPVGRINVADEKLIVGRGLAAIRHNHGWQSFMLYALKHQFAEEDSIGDGTIFTAVTKKDMEGIRLVEPTEAAGMGYEKMASAIDRQIGLNDRESRTLAETRDALLPKLLSGEVCLASPSSPSDSAPIAPSIHQILAMVRLADELESAPTPKWTGPQHNGSHQAVMPVLDNGPAIERFEQQAYENGFVIEFDWTEWQKQAGQYFSDPARLAKADVHTIQRLVTTCVRKERFCEGTLASLHANGVLAAICRRLGQIAKESSK